MSHRVIVSAVNRWGGDPSNQATGSGAAQRRLANQQRQTGMCSRMRYDDLVALTDDPMRQDPSAPA